MFRVRNRFFVKFDFLLRDGSRKTVDGVPGVSLLKTAHENGVDLEGACEESLACSTCHLILEPKIFDSIPPASEREEDLLDLAPGLTNTSRLGCQVKVHECMQGALFALPKTTLNFYVDGHVPKPH